MVPSPFRIQVSIGNKKKFVVHLVGSTQFGESILGVCCGVEANGNLV